MFVLSRHDFHRHLYFHLNEIVLTDASVMWKTQIKSHLGVWCPQEHCFWSCVDLKTRQLIRRSVYKRTESSEKCLVPRVQASVLKTLVLSN